MAILSRFSEILKSNINSLLDKCEDPAKIIDQNLRDLREDLAEVKKETAGIIAHEKRDLRALEEYEKEIEKVTVAAKNALKLNEEEDAKKLIARKQELEANLEKLKKNYELSKANSEKMRQMYNKLVSDINELETKRDSIKATLANAKAQEKINKMVSSPDSNRSMDAFERMEAKANDKLDRALAEANLNEVKDESDDLLDKYSSSTSNLSVEEELARLKAEL